MCAFQDLMEGFSKLGPVMGEMLQHTSDTLSVGFAHTVALLDSRSLWA